MNYATTIIRASSQPLTTSRNITTTSRQRKEKVAGTIVTERQRTRTIDGMRTRNETRLSTKSNERGMTKVVRAIQKYAKKKIIIKTNPQNITTRSKISLQQNINNLHKNLLEYIYTKNI